MIPKQQFTLADGAPLTRQESFVLRQVAKGEIADLKKEFGEPEEGRRLRALFLEELLTGELKGVKIHRKGVWIENGVLEDPLELENAEVAVRVELTACMFKEAVNLRDAAFHGHLGFNDSDISKMADFHRLKVAGNLFCRDTIFAGQVDLGGADIKAQFIGMGAKFLSLEGEANFNAMQVGLDARFDDSEFHGPVNFLGANIRRQLVSQGAKFLNKADFHRMQIGQDAFFRGCDFHGLVSFVLMKIAGDLHLEPILKLGNEIASRFHSDVNFRGAEIGGELLADKAHFLGHIVNFEAVKVGRSFHASGAIFAGPVNFTEMEVRNNFYIDPYGRSRLAKTLFKGPANFSRLSVAGVFNADQAIFKSESTIFSGLKVGQGAFFNGTIFFGGLVLKEGQLTDLVIRGLHRFSKGELSKGSLPLEEIVLNRTKIAHRLTIEHIEVKRFDARNLEVKGPAELRRLVITGEADLRDAALDHLQIVETDWPEPRDSKKKVFLDGLTYESITTETDPDKKEDWPKLLAWLGLGRFNTQNYQQLDAFFQRGGLKNRADEVYISGKRREKRNSLRELKTLSWWNPARWLIWLTLWLTRFFWGLLAGYGRKPGRVFWPSLALVLLGWLIYNPVCPEPTHWLASFQQSHPAWTGLVVSLDRFLPGVDLGVAKICQPGDLSPFIWFYWHFLKIMGWILAPIGLAAVYTRLK